MWTAVQSLYGEVSKREGWDEKKVVDFQEVNSFVLDVRMLSPMLILYFLTRIQFTFTVFSRCGFGFEAPWSQSAVENEGILYQLRIVSRTLIARMVIPPWAYCLPFKRFA